MAEDGAGATQVQRNAFLDRRIERLEIELIGIVARKHPPQRTHCLTIDGLVKGDAEVISIDHAQIDAGFARTRGVVPRTVRHVQGHGVEEGCMRKRVAETLKATDQDLQQSMHAPGDQVQTLGAVIDRIETGNHRQQDLRGADIAGGLLATDVLLAGLQRHAQGDASVTITRHTDDAARHGTYKALAGGKKSRVRPAITHRHTEALGAANHDIRIHFTRRLQ